MKTAYLHFEKIDGYPEFEWVPRNQSGEQIAQADMDFDVACENSVDSGYANCVYVPRQPILVASCKEQTK